MLDLMAVNGSSMPLYLHVVTRVLREMRIAQQHSGGAFNYALFKANIMSEDLTPAQLAPFQQRLDTLESFMPKHQTSYSAMGKKKPRDPTGTDWKSQVRLAIWGFFSSLISYRKRMLTHGSAGWTTHNRRLVMSVRDT